MKLFYRYYFLIVEIFCYRILRKGGETLGKFGLTAPELFELGYQEYMDTSNAFICKIFANSDLFKNAAVLKGSLESAANEALLRAISEMIVKNNESLRDALAGAGLLSRE
ncbi:MAG: hypothetical protein BWY80_00038 [Firmicutes bacterium ADurb.Bin456]|nr:MAG: hypothetical protein BWY80_00038 [Firmicutes bacterium ADurb.Bin456]